MSRVVLCPGPHQVLPNPPAFPHRSGGVLVCARSLSESGRVAAALMPRVRHRSEAVEIDHGQLVYPSLNRFAIVMDLHELGPGFGVTRSAGCRRRRLGTRAKTPPPTRAISFAQASSRRVMRAGLCLSVAAASGAVTVVSVPANRGLALRADPGTQTARVRPSRSRRAAWTCARGRGRPSWPLFVAGARSGCGRRRRGSRRAVPGRMAAGRSTAAGVREADTRHALGAVRA